jgi:hypothetical protein
VNNTISPSITLTSDTNVRKNLNFILYPTYLSLDTTITDINPIIKTQNDLSIYPNPFSSSTTIEYTLTQRSHIKLSLEDITGKEICILKDAVLEDGKYATVLNSDQQNLSAGMYFVKLEADDKIVAKRVVVIK